MYSVCGERAMVLSATLCFRHSAIAKKPSVCCIESQSSCIRNLAGSPPHLVRQHEEVRGEGELKCLGGFEVEHQLVLRGLLHGEVGGLRTLQDLVHVGGGTTPTLRKVWLVVHETTGFRIPHLAGHCWQAARQRPLCEPCRLNARDACARSGCSTSEDVVEEMCAYEATRKAAAANDPCRPTWYGVECRRPPGAHSRSGAL